MTAQGKGIKKIEIPKEGVMAKLFKVKPGALSAFGKIHNLEVYVDKSLKKAKKTIFSSGSFTDSIEMAFTEFEKLEEPIQGLFSKAKKIKKQVIKKVKTSKPTKKLSKKKLVKKVKKIVKKAQKKTAKPVKKIKKAVKKAKTRRSRATV
jgi:hypothetical protein